MKVSRSLLILTVGVALVCCGAARAEQHRATRLGHPSTRFAPPLVTPEDLRSRFRDEKLQPDFLEVLRQWNWTGDWEDLLKAALNSPITAVDIPVGSTMPFMSSRNNGKPICLRNVLWAGPAPAPAFAFQFNSKGRAYRCVTPKACSNFFLEDLGPEPKPALALDCGVPAEILAGRPLEACFTLRNTGRGAEPMATLILPIPANAKFVRASEGGVPTETQITWQIPALAPGATAHACAFFAAREPGTVTFSPRSTAERAAPVETTCSTVVAGIPAILLELIDLEDPIEVGKEVTYEIRVTNQGSAQATNVRLVCHIPPSEEYISSSGATPVQGTPRLLTTDSLPNLAPKALASWRVVVKAIQPDDARFKVQLTSDQFTLPIDEAESTEIY